MTSIREQLLAELPDAELIVRAPGRVNLIGEHTDYNGFPVLPMAIAPSVWIAVARREDGLLHIRNLDATRFPEEMIGAPDVKDRPRRGFWSDYVIAAARELPALEGAELLVGSDLPVAAGLSSSAALVVASLLALVDEATAADRATLAGTAIRAEQFIGTMVGGMDQTVCLLAQDQHALRIDFRPLRTTPVALPSDLRIVVIDSGVRAEKGGAAQEAYNERVLACAAAAKLLGAPPGGLLGDVPAERLPEVANLESELLRKRAGFVFAEANRVDAAIAALEAAELEAFGELLDASHRGLRDDYEVSHPEVDRLVERAKSAGALGARIVGAGFGGSLIAAVRAADAAAVVAEFGEAARVVAPGAGAERQRLGA
jgi:galactokinase